MSDLKWAALFRQVDESVIDDVYIDLDGVTADFEKAMNERGHTAEKFKLSTGSYLWLEPIEGAIEAVNLLRHCFPKRCWFLTKPPKFSPYAYVEKALWVQRYFGDDGLHSLIVTQDKSLVGTEKSIIVEDRPHKGNVERFRGTVIHFGAPINTSSPRSNILPAPNWEVSLETIANIIKRRTE